MTAVNWTNVSTASQFLATANTNTGGYFWAVILYMVVIVITIAMLNFGLEVAVLASVFIGIIAGIKLGIAHGYLSENLES